MVRLGVHPNHQGKETVTSDDETIENPSAVQPLNLPSKTLNRQTGSDFPPHARRIDKLFYRRTKALLAVIANNLFYLFSSRYLLSSTWHLTPF